MYRRASSFSTLRVLALHFLPNWSCIAEFIRGCLTNHACCSLSLLLHSLTSHSGICFASTKMLSMFKVCELHTTETSSFASENVRSLLRQGEEQTRQGHWQACVFDRLRFRHQPNWGWLLNEHLPRAGFCQQNQSIGRWLKTAWL